MTSEGTLGTGLDLAHENEVLSEVLTSLIAYVRSSIKRDVLQRLEKRGIEEADADYLTLMIEGQSHRHLCGWVFVSSCSLLEHSLNQISLETFSTADRNKLIRHTDFGGSALDRWTKFFDKLHGIKFLSASERGFVEYLYLLRNVYAHQNGFVIDKKVLAEVEKALAKLEPELKRLLAVSVGQQGEVHVSLKGLLLVPRRAKLIVECVLQRVSDKLHGNPVGARKIRNLLNELLE